MADELIKNIQMKAVVNEQRINAYPITTIENVNGLSEILNNVPTINDVELALDGTIKLANVGTLSSSKKYALVPGNEAGVYTLSEVIEGSGSGSTPVDPVVADAVWTVFDTPEAVSDFMTEENVGKLVFYTGESFEDIFKDSLYRVIKEENDQEVEYSLDLIYASADRTGDVLADITTDISQLKNDVIDLQNNSSSGGSNDYYELDNIPVKKMPEQTMRDLSIGDNLTSVYIDTTVMPDWSSLCSYDNLAMARFEIDKLPSYCSSDYYDPLIYTVSDRAPSEARNNDHWFNTRNDILFRYNESTKNWDSVTVIDLSQYDAIKFIERYDLSKDEETGMVDLSNKVKEWDVICYEESSQYFTGYGRNHREERLDNFYHYDESENLLETYKLDEWIDTSFTEVANIDYGLEWTEGINKFYRDKESNRFAYRIYDINDNSSYTSNSEYISTNSSNPTRIGNSDIYLYCWYDQDNEKLYTATASWVDITNRMYVIDESLAGTQLYFKKSNKFSIYYTKGEGYYVLLTMPNDYASIFAEVRNNSRTGKPIVLLQGYFIGDDMPFMINEDYWGFPGQTWLIDSGVYDISGQDEGPATVIHADSSLLGENGFIKVIDKHLEDGTYYIKEATPEVITPIEVGMNTPIFKTDVSIVDFSPLDSVEPEKTLTSFGMTTAVKIYNEDNTWNYHDSRTETFEYMESSITEEFKNAMIYQYLDYEVSFDGVILADMINQEIYQYKAYTDNNSLTYRDSTNDYDSTLVDPANYTILYNVSNENALPQDASVGDIVVIVSESMDTVVYYTESRGWYRYPGSYYFYTASQSNTTKVTKFDISDEIYFDWSHPTLCYDKSNNNLYKVQPAYTAVDSVIFAETYPEYIYKDSSDGKIYMSYLDSDSYDTSVMELTYLESDTAPVDISVIGSYFYNTEDNKLYISTPKFVEVSWMMSAPENPQVGDIVAGEGFFRYEESTENGETVIVPVSIMDKLAFRKSDITETGKYFADEASMKIYFCDEMYFKEVDLHNTAPVNDETFWMNRQTKKLFIYSYDVNQEVSEWEELDDKEYEMSNCGPSDRRLWYNPATDIVKLTYKTSEENLQPGDIVVSGIMEVPFYKLCDGMLPEFGDIGLYAFKADMDMVSGDKTYTMHNAEIAFLKPGFTMEALYGGSDMLQVYYLNLMIDPATGKILDGSGGWEDHDVMDSSGKMTIPFLIDTINEDCTEFLNSIACKKYEAATLDSIVQCIDGNLVPIGSVSSSKKSVIEIHFNNFDWNLTSNYGPFKYRTYYQINKNELSGYGINLSSNDNYIFEVINDNPLLLGQTGFVLQRAESYDDYLQLECYCIKNSYTNTNGTIKIKVSKE